MLFLRSGGNLGAWRAEVELHLITDHSRLMPWQTMLFAALFGLVEN